MIKKILILFLILLPLGVKAENEDIANVILSCDKTKLSPVDDTATCTLKLDVKKGNVYTLFSALNLSDNLSIEGDINYLLTNIKIHSSRKNRIDIGTTERQKSIVSSSDGVVDIANFKVKAASSVTGGIAEKVSLMDISIGINDDVESDVCIPAPEGAIKECLSETKLTNSTIDLRIMSTVNTLSNLTISNGMLSSNFSSDKTDYDATVDVDKVTITATKTDDKSIVSGDVGEVNLNYGENIFMINVTSESGFTRVYKLKIIRNDNRDKNNSLKTLSFNGQNVDLKLDKNDYSYEVENDVTQIILNAELVSNNAKFVENYGPRTVELDEGLNSILIKIRAENDDVKTYTLNITRKSETPGTGENPGEGGENPGEGGENPGEGGGNPGNEPVPDSPPTGSLELFIVLGIVVVSIVGLVYYFNQYQKKQGVSNDEKK